MPRVVFTVHVDKANESSVPLRSLQTPMILVNTFESNCQKRATRHYFVI